MEPIALSTIRVSGSDARDFLQGQLTNDVGRLDSEAEILAAWCNPKGRVIWFGPLRMRGDGFGLSAPAETADAVVKRMTMFRFRAKVSFEVIDEGETADPASLVENGVPFIGAAQVEQFTPHMLNLDLLDAISYDKGCYTGQEIVARTHYKGATKRRTMRFRLDGSAAAGDKLSDGERDVGEVLNAGDRCLLAVVPIDKAGEPLSVNGQALTHDPLPYL